jgi:hypothetical protein
MELAVQQRADVHQRADVQRRPSRSAVSECWVYTRNDGLREVTLASPSAILDVDGETLRSWCLLDRTGLGCGLAILYSVEAPSRELSERVTHLARARFANQPWFRAMAEA